MAKSYIMALDQGTTSSRAIVFDRAGATVAIAQKEFAQHYPQPGWVEHDPQEIWTTQREVVRAAIRNAGLSCSQLSAIGITNQRETTILWDRRTGEPISNAVVWQCRRSTSICESLLAAGHGTLILNRTGLVVDAYFSGTKIKWLLDNTPGARVRAERGDLAFGTVDSWLLWNLTDGAVHATDVTNAARTMLFDIHQLCWDREILDLLEIPESLLPEVRPSSGMFGETGGDHFDGVRIPICGVAGDQHAALFGQAAFEPGMTKNTYGTGCFILVNTGDEAVASTNRLLTTPAWSVEPGRATYAMEGSVFVAGAAVQWLRDSMKVISNAGESEHFATQIDSTDGVYVVPAFVGLGAPYWDSHARGGVLGLTARTGRNHLIRATLESIAYQTRDVIEAVRADRAAELAVVRVDGGASGNNFLMQFQADMLGMPVERPQNTETTALGAAYLAGLHVGYWADMSELASLWMLDRRFEPKMSKERRDHLYAGWKKAVCRVSDWARDE